MCLSAITTIFKWLETFFCKVKMCPFPLAIIDELWMLNIFWFGCFQYFIVDKLKWTCAWSHVVSNCECKRSACRLYIFGRKWTATEWFFHTLHVCCWPMNRPHNFLNTSYRIISSFSFYSPFCALNLCWSAYKHQVFKNYKLLLPGSPFFPFSSSISDNKCFP